jgi:ABC-type polysaccharide/polyol phosphate transport system ATPase subunit
MSSNAAPAGQSAAASVDVAIRVRGLGKAYKVYDRTSDLIRETLTGRAMHKDVWALQDVSFEVPRGSVTGVIGSNGSGKSTLLKIVTGLLDATTGSVEVAGRVSAILELGTGFHPDFSGRDNIITGGMCLGMSRQEVEAKVPWIIDFSEMAEVIDQPFRTYSSGMQARLTFSTAIAVDPEVLVIDEALAAGDAYFVAKCFRRMREICESGATVLFVSHSTGQVAQLCDTAIWIDKGKLREVGPAREVTRRYDYAVHGRLSGGTGRIVTLDADATKAPQSDKPAPPREIFRKGPVIIEDVRFVDGDGVATDLFRTWDAWRLEVHYSCETPPSEMLGLAMTIERERDLLRVAQFNTNNPAGRDDDPDCQIRFEKRIGRKGVVSCTMPKLQLLEGDYVVSLALLPNITGVNEYYEYHQRTHRFTVIPAAYPSGAVFYPLVEWSHDVEEGTKE